MGSPAAPPPARVQMGHSVRGQWVSAAVAALVLSCLAAATATDGTELLADRNFFLLSSVDRANSAGTYSSVRAGADMAEFPGTISSALELLPAGGRTKVVLSSREPPRTQELGWYRISMHVRMSFDYNGGADWTAVQHTDTVKITVLGSTGEAVLVFPFVLRSYWKGEYLHYDEWVPCNVVGTTGVRIEVTPGLQFSTGSLTLTGVSVTRALFTDRVASTLGREGGMLVANPLWPAEEARWPHAGAGAGSGAFPDCRPAEAAAHGLPPPTVAGECPAGYGDSEIEMAFDGKTETAWHVSAMLSSMAALELDLNEVVAVCAVQLWFPDAYYPTTWRIKAIESDRTVGDSNGYGWSYTDASDDLFKTWATAGPEGTAGVDVTSGPGLVTVAFAECIATQRLRLEMDVPGGAIVMSLNEIVIHSTLPVEGCQRPHPYGCRHGGTCGDDGMCTCPFSTGCTKAACGFTGEGCQQPRCVPSIARSCKGVLGAPTGSCGGANTCTCNAGWHDTDCTRTPDPPHGCIAGSVVTLCTASQCGDGAVTTRTGEQCDDGNVAPGDGCGASCQYEPLPENVYRSISTTTVVVSTIPRAHSGFDDAVGTPTPLEVGLIVGVPQELISDVRVAAGLVTFNQYEFILTCNIDCGTGACVIVDNKESCECGSGWTGEDCKMSPCSFGCGISGVCVAPDTCECSGGWIGDNCGTIEGPAAAIVFIAGVVIAAALAISAMITAIKRKWPPIKARDPLIMLFGHFGGLIWAVTAAIKLRGEPLGFNINSSLWTQWLPLAFGFGFWLASILAAMYEALHLHVYQNEKGAPSLRSGRTNLHFVQSYPSCNLALLALWPAKDCLCGCPRSSGQGGDNAVHMSAPVDRSLHIREVFCHGHCGGDERRR